MEEQQLSIRYLSEMDYPDWKPLWDGNNKGELPEEVTGTTWARLLSPDVQLWGFGGWMDGRLVAIVHFVLHPVAGAVQPVCYMQDVYTAPDYRGRGIARAMIGELAGLGKKQGWTRLYWLAEDTNEAAQHLYKRLGMKLDFSFFVLPLSDQEKSP